MYSGFLPHQTLTLGVMENLCQLQMKMYSIDKRPDCPHQNWVNVFGIFKCFDFRKLLHDEHYLCWYILLFFVCLFVFVSSSKRSCLQSGITIQWQKPVTFGDAEIDHFKLMVSCHLLKKEDLLYEQRLCKFRSFFFTLVLFGSSLIAFLPH